MTKIGREKRVIAQMVAIWCKAKHKHREGLCDKCGALLDYAEQRLSHCPHGEQKGSCRKCTIHCYAPKQREEMRNVMRYVGPRMIFHHPIAAIRHLISELR